MKDLLAKVQLKRGRSSEGLVSPQTWRRVPKINLLSKPTATYYSKTYVYAALAILLLLGVYYTSSSYLKLRDLKAQTVNANTEFANMQRTVSTKQDEVNNLKEQVNQLKQQQESVHQAYNALQSGRMNWDKALPAIFSSQVAGITFQSVTSKSANSVEIQGTASDQGAIAGLQVALVGMSSTFELQGVSVELRDRAYHFVAQITLKKE